MPNFLKEFAVMLPLLQPWNGPIADVEHIYRAMLLVDFPPRAQIEYLEQQKKQQQHFAQQQQQLLQQQQQNESSQRRDDHGGGDGDGGSVSNKRPPNDIFRTRQKLKLAKLA
jgi:cleavage stimulation factor subunit 3